MSFPSLEAAHDFLVKENYAKRTTSDTFDKFVIRYRCTKVPRSHKNNNIEQCKSLRSIVIDKEKDNAYTIMKTQFEHNHEEIIAKYNIPKKISDEMKREIISLHKKRVTPKNITKN